MTPSIDRRRGRGLLGLPADFYDLAVETARLKGIGLAFSEIGWTHLEPFRSGHETADEAQAAFYARFKDILDASRADSDVEVEFVSWGLLYGADGIGAEWEDLGLYHRDGTEKPTLYPRSSPTGESVRSGWS